MSYRRSRWWLWNFRIVWWLWEVRTRILYRLTGECGNCCRHAEPYGWVPEAGCPIHDLED